MSCDTLGPTSARSSFVQFVAMAGLVQDHLAGVGVQQALSGRHVMHQQVPAPAATVAGQVTRSNASTNPAVIAGPNGVPLRPERRRRPTR